MGNRKAVLQKPHVGVQLRICLSEAPVALRTTPRWVATRWVAAEGGVAQDLHLGTVALPVPRWSLCRRVYGYRKAVPDLD